ncbi:MAG: DUF4132 domain-containing protein, partial [Verrucomicrobiota bacterium]|nr:DUF4132 domain-containing protein [Verrucomicrobiota bacterium]
MQPNGEWTRESKPFPAPVIDDVFGFLQEPLPASLGVASEGLSYALWLPLPEAEALRRFWKTPELSLVHLLRFCLLDGAFTDRHDPFRPIIPKKFTRFLESFRETHPGVGLREVAAAFSAVGLDPELPGRAQFSRNDENPLAWSAEEVWPYWAEHLDLLGEYFQPPSDDWRTRHWREKALEVLALFPQPPPRFAPALWDLALGATKAHRAAAQQCLERARDKRERIIAALGSGTAETRAVAADWLRRLREPSAVEPLLAALRKEKNEATKAAMMSALEQLGVPVEQFLDRPGLREEAVKGLAKGVPAALASFRFDTLPAVHWADTGARVEPEIVRYWLAQHGKLKNPEPGPLLRRYCAALCAGEREKLGQFVLDAWIATDTAVISRAEAEQAARQHAQMMVHHQQWLAQRAQQYPQAGAPALAAPKTLEEYYAAALPGFLEKPRGSAIEAKGVLAVAAACGGANSAPVVRRYLKQWYGTRTAQCRALLRMLAWVDDPAATQLLLATGSRFRTKGLQEEASNQAHALAERKGWTVEELSDRTIPVAGLDEDGVLELDFGARQFTARLNEKLELTLFAPNGEPIQTLPDPRRDDDEPKAAEAKKQLGAAKKELKSVLLMQRERLYEAMCVQRNWRGEDWELYLNRHPILRHYTPRLVWAVMKADEPPLFFRPLPDGSLTDTNDDAVLLPADAAVRVAHQCHT